MDILLFCHQLCPISHFISPIVLWNVANMVVYVCVCVCCVCIIAALLPHVSSALPPPPSALPSPQLPPPSPLPQLPPLPQNPQPGGPINLRLWLVARSVLCVCGHPYMPRCLQLRKQLQVYTSYIITHQYINSYIISIYANIHILIIACVNIANR